MENLNIEKDVLAKGETYITQFFSTIKIEIIHFSSLKPLKLNTIHIYTDGLRCNFD